MALTLHNHSHILAEGFVTLFVRPVPSTTERQAMVAALVSVFESVYAFGCDRAQLEFSNKLRTAIGARPTVPAEELIALASSLE